MANEQLEIPNFGDQRGFNLKIVIGYFDRCLF